MKAKIAIIGKGNIGWAIKQLLKDEYGMKHGDITEGLDARDISRSLNRQSYWSAGLHPHEADEFYLNIRQNGVPAWYNH